MNKEIEKYIDFCKNYDYYFNPYEMLNMSEPTISQFLVWLLDTEKTENKCVVEIKEKFRKEFLKLITDSRATDDEIKIIKLVPEYKIEDSRVRIDIYMETDNFIFIIENKKRAKFSTSKDGDNRKIQIERYREKFKDEHDNKVVKYIYLCAEKEDTEKKICARLSDIKSNNSNMCKKLTIDGMSYDKYANMRISDILENHFKYKIIEHSEIVKILYNILIDDDRYNKFFEDKILKPLKYQEMINMVNKFKSLYNEGKTKNIIDKLIKNNNPDSIYTLYKSEIKEFTDSKDKNREDNYFRYEDDILKNIFKNKKLGFSYNTKIYGNAVMQIYGKFKEIKSDTDDCPEDFEIQMLLRYIEYWELHKGIGGLSDNLTGYTKIVNGEYLWNICKKLLNNTKEWIELRSEIFNEKYDKKLYQLKETIRWIEHTKIIEIMDELIKQYGINICNEYNKSGEIGFEFNLNNHQYKYHYNYNKYLAKKYGIITIDCDKKSYISIQKDDLIYRNNIDGAKYIMEKLK